MGAGRVIGLDEAEAGLPHRYPMLLDRVVEHVPGLEIGAVKAITANEPWYRSPGDGAPASEYVYPAALLENDRIVMVTRPAGEVPGAPRGRRSDDGVS
jgi:hypothetical protein